jgi:hypothetical protein
MDIQSFILGMSLVLVIAMAVVSVYAIVKVMKLKADLMGLNIWSNQEIENLKKQFGTKDMALDYKIGNIYKDMDSRLDKLYEKIMKNKSPKNEVFEMADKDGFKKSLLQVLNNEDEGNDLKNRILQLMNK